jgi:hypothetical protein
LSWVALGIDFLNNYPIINYRKEANIMPEQNGQYGVIHETGDLGLGFDVLGKQDQATLKSDEERRKKEENGQKK